MRIQAIEIVLSFEDYLHYRDSDGVEILALTSSAAERILEIVPDADFQNISIYLPENSCKYRITRYTEDSSGPDEFRLYSQVSDTMPPISSDGKRSVQIIDANGQALASSAICNSTDGRLRGMLSTRLAPPRELPIPPVRSR